MIGVIGQLCCQTPIMSGAARQGEPQGKLAKLRGRLAGRESQFFEAGAKAPAPEQGERANTDWRSVSVVRSVFARSSRCRWTSERGPRQGRQGANGDPVRGGLQARRHKVLAIPRAPQRHGQNRDHRDRPLSTGARAIVARGVRGGIEEEHHANERNCIPEHSGVAT